MRRLCRIKEELSQQDRKKKTSFLRSKRINAYLCSSNDKIIIDMALTAVLQFGSNTTKRYYKQYMVSDCHIVHKRKYSKFCPEGSASCERLEVSIVSPGRDDLEIFEWYDSQNAQEGRIVITTTSVKASDSDSEHIIYFENAHCFSLSENYDISVARRRIIKLAIEAETIHIDDITIKRV